MDIYKSLSEEFLISESDIVDYIKRAPHRYKVYKIDKRNSRGKRTIAQPARELKAFQKIALNHPLMDLPIHKAAFAYRDKLGIKQNAEMHSKNQYLLKMDFSDFFPSIVDEDLVKHIEKYHGVISFRDRLAIKKLFFWHKKGDAENRLSIGAPSSPFISNTILYDFDEKLNDICNTLTVIYTRYADDLTFTTNKAGVLSEIPKIVEDVLASIQYPKLRINLAKTVFSSKKNNRHVTGLVLSNDNNVSLGRKRKRYIRSLVFKFINGNLSKDETETLKGLLGFSKHVEPAFYCSLIKKYTYQKIEEIEKFDITSGIY